MKLGIPSFGILKSSAIKMARSKQALKSNLELCMAKISSQRKKRNETVKTMTKDVVVLLKSGTESKFRIASLRAEHIIRDLNRMDAHTIMYFFCERILWNLTIIVKQRICPEGLKEEISSLVFASAKCLDIPQLGKLKDIFRKKYGEEFVSAAIGVRPNCGVNRTLIQMLSDLKPTTPAKVKVLSEIAEKHKLRLHLPSIEEEEPTRIANTDSIHRMRVCETCSSRILYEVSSSSEREYGSPDCERFENFNVDSPLTNRGDAA